MKIIKMMPEASNCAYVKIANRRIEGARKVLVVATETELWEKLPAIVQALADPEHQHLRVIKVIGHCRKCDEDQRLNPEDPPKPCLHPISDVEATINQAFNVDVKALLQKNQPNKINA
ncbi:MAG: hypothetical protein WC473_03830 [Patescibacteria group bacterium]